MENAKFTITRSCYVNGEVCDPGTVVELPANSGAALVSANKAVAGEAVAGEAKSPAKKKATSRKAAD